MALAFLHENDSGCLGLGRRDHLGIIDPGQWTDPVPAFVFAQSLDIREFHVGPTSDLFPKMVEIVPVIDIVKENLPMSAPGPKATMVEIEAAPFA